MKMYMSDSALDVTDLKKGKKMKEKKVLLLYFILAECGPSGHLCSVRMFFVGPSGLLSAHRAAALSEKFFFTWNSSWASL